MYIVTLRYMGASGQVIRYLASADDVQHTTDDVNLAYKFTEERAVKRMFIKCVYKFGGIDCKIGIQVCDNGEE